MDILLRPLLALTLLASASALAASEDAAASSERKGSSPVRVESVEVMPSPMGPVVVLNVANRSIPVFVDQVVAISIQSALAGKGLSRPLTHDLTQKILESLDAKATEVVITLDNGLFRGALTINAGGKTQVFDSRASDAIALALRFNAPILVDPSVVESAGIEQKATQSQPSQGL